jgi:hypothetical protein
MYLDDGVRCDLCGAFLRAAGEARFQKAGRAGWTWFHGYRTTVFHACPDCRRNHPERIAAELTASQQRPPADESNR